MGAERGVATVLLLNGFGVEKASLASDGVGIAVGIGISVDIRVEFVLVLTEVMQTNTIAPLDIPKIIP